MLSLIIETSSTKGLVAILENQKVLFCEEIPFGIRESKEIIPELVAALKHLDMSLNAITKIILGIGPGSFTGIRVGASIAKALSYAKNLPIYEVSSLKAFTPLQNGPFGVLLDAKSHGVLLQRGFKDPHSVQYEEKAYLFPLNQVSKQIEDLPYLICAQKKPLREKFQKNQLEVDLIELSPNPVQIYNEAMSGSDKSLSANEKLNLKYFDSTL